MAKVTTYKNSRLATFCSFLGYIVILLGVYAFFEEAFGIVVGIVALAIGIALKLLAGFISQKKREKEAKQSQNI